MALDNFRAPPLPAPPAQWDAQYMRQLIRALETYFSQLDSRTPNNAEKYTAETFHGIAATKRMTTAQKMALAAEAGWVVFDTTLNKLSVYNGTTWETITSV